MITQAANIEREQSQIEWEIAQKLMNMEDVEIDTGRKIFAQDVVDEMYELDPDRFCLAIFLCSQQRKGQIDQGCGIFTDLRKDAINRLIQAHGADIYTLARQRVEGRTMEVPHAVA